MTSERQPPSVTSRVTPIAMKQLTIRGVDDRLHQLLREQAERKGISVNAYVLQLLKKTHHVVGEPRDLPQIYHDLDHLAGTWSDDDATQFDQELA